MFIFTVFLMRILLKAHKEKGEKSACKTIPFQMQKYKL